MITEHMTLDPSNITENAYAKPKPKPKLRVKCKTTPDNRVAGECNIPMVIIQYSYMEFIAVNIHSTVGSNVLEAGQSGDKDATGASGKKMLSGSAGRRPQALNSNAVAGPSNSDRQRRPPKWPDADVPTPSPKRRRK